MTAGAIPIPDELAPALQPVEALLRQAAERLPPAPPLRLEVGEVQGFRRLEGDRLVLDRGLLEGSVHHPDEPDGPLPPLDRWRRLLASVLEGHVLAWLRERVGRDLQGTWIGEGLAVHLADRAAEGVGLALPDLALAASEGDLAGHPRGGVVAFRHAEQAGRDPVEAALEWVERPPDAAAFLEIARFALDPERLRFPVPVRRAVRLVPRLGPWSFGWMTWSGGERGGRLEVEGEGAVDPSWVPAGEEVRVLAASVSGIAVSLAPGFPAGRWRFASGRGFGQILGVRGVDFLFEEDGGLEIVLADAFVGPLPALPLAEKLGTSGVIRGRWRICGPGEIGFSGLVPMGIVVQDRQHGAVAQGSLGLESQLEHLQDGPWGWTLQAGELHLQGRVGNVSVELRLVREGR